MQANALLAGASQSAIVLGPLLAAVAIGTIGIEGAFIIDALTYVVGALVLIPFAIGRTEGRVRRQHGDGRAARRVPGRPASGRGCGCCSACPAAST